MAPFASIITVSFEKSLADFPVKKTHWLGNPVRADILKGDKKAADNFFKLELGLPTILIIGGGTGAQSLNNLVLDSLSELVKFCQLIHLTGGRTDKTLEHPRYHPFDFLADNLKDAYAVSDLAVSRAGMSVLSELSAMAKPAIIIPISASHQEENAVEFFKNNAVKILNEDVLSTQDFSAAIKQLLFDRPELDNLSRNMAKVMPRNAAEKIAAMIL